LTRFQTEFHAGLKRLAEKLQVQIHEESPQVTLEACKLVVEALVMAKDSGNIREKLMNKNALPLGFDTGDPIMNDAGKYPYTVQGGRI